MTVLLWKKNGETGWLLSRVCVLEGKFVGWFGWVSGCLIRWTIILVGF